MHRQSHQQRLRVSLLGGDVSPHFGLGLVNFVALSPAFGVIAGSMWLPMLSVLRTALAINPRSPAGGRGSFASFASFALVSFALASLAVSVLGLPCCGRGALSCGCCFSGVGFESCLFGYASFLEILDHDFTWGSRFQVRGSIPIHSRPLVHCAF